MAASLRIGLTGGIGSGKSTAADGFARRGAAIIDTDLIARELVEPGQPALGEIVDTFGDTVLDRDGRLDRARLRERVFGKPQQRARLEQILHPRIRERALTEAESANSAYCILVIPLLVEAGAGYPLDRVLVVDAPVELQIRRVQERDGIDASQARAILDAQASRQQRLDLADDVIVNDGDLERLDAQVARLHDFYLQLAHRGS